MGEQSVIDCRAGECVNNSAGTGVCNLKRVQLSGKGVCLNRVVQVPSANQEGADDKQGEEEA